MKIAYNEIGMDDVMGFFIAGYKPKEGTITKSEWFYDSNKGKVVVKLFIDEKLDTNNIILTPPKI